jgi:hypothetical protein
MTGFVSALSTVILYGTFVGQVDAARGGWLLNQHRAWR